MLMAEWGPDRKIMVVGMGIGMLTALGEIFSKVMRAHPIYPWIMGVVAALMIIIPIGHTLSLWATQKRASVNSESPLEIIFEPLNPARRFWSLESSYDDYNRLRATYWEHRVEIKNNSRVTLRNVTVLVERVGVLPNRPSAASFVRTKNDSCDINPGCSELAAVSRWPYPKKQVGMLCGESAWGYGPIKIIASAEDTPPTEVVYDFNYETEQMLFERGMRQA